MKQSSIELNLPSLKREVSKKKELQRTEKWRKQRMGRWTGSMFKALMTNEPGKSKLEWDNLDRLFSFGTSAIKYIYSNAMERKRGVYIDKGDGTLEMKYGTAVEPLIFRATKKKIKEMGVKGKLKKVGFVNFPNMPNAGVSSDAKIVDKKNNTKASVEMKACTSWETHYERTFEITSDKSKDFWQVTGQVMGHDVTKCYYVVAEPPQDIKKYVYYDGNIMDLYDDFVKECPISIEVIKPSKTHTEALRKRIMIAEDALSDWISLGGSLRDILNKTIKSYENKPSLFDTYTPPLHLQNKK